jgi:hypothetical protein
MASGVAHPDVARSRSAHTHCTADRRSCSLPRNRNAPERTPEDACRVHGGEVVASSPVQQEPRDLVEMDALRKLIHTGADHETAAAWQRCSASRLRSGDSCARRSDRSRAAATSRSPCRSTCSLDRIASRSPPDHDTGRRRANDGCPRWRQLAIRGWTPWGTMGDTAPSRRRGSPCRVFKEARVVATPSTGLPLFLGGWRRRL